MSEHRRSSEQRLLALSRYIGALEQGDLDTLATILSAASHDFTLSALLEELDTIYQTLDGTSVSDLEARQAFYSVLPSDQRSDLARESQAPFVQNIPVQYRKSRPGIFTEEQVTLELPQVQNHHQPPTRPRKRGRGLQLLAALLVVCLLIGGMLIGLRSIYPHVSGAKGTPGPTAPSSSPKVPTWGQALSSKVESMGFGGLALSPDSQRVAVLDYAGAQIWDATTGAHLSTIPLYVLPVNASRITWSPNGKWLAVAGETGIVTVDARTGTVVHQFLAASLLENFPVTLPNFSLFSLLRPVNGGTLWEISGLAWSPDSRLLAVTIDSATVAYRHFSILNAQTGALVHRFPDAASSSITVTGWSSDGKYLAAMVENSSDRGLWIAQVWDMPDYHSVFQKVIGGDFVLEFTGEDKLVWQPHSDNLAFAQNPKGPYTGIVLWDVVHNTLLKQYNIPDTGLLALSPDGKYLATVNTARQLIAIDVQSGQQVYVYKQPEMSIIFLTWSPNSHYIAVITDTFVSLLGAE